MPNTLDALAEPPAIGPVAGTGPPALFDALLTPHRSLPRIGFFILMAVVVGACGTMAVLFLAQGAWPVVGFYGLEVLVLFWALRQNYRSGRVYERVRLTDGMLTLERGDDRGPLAVVTLQPYWARVQVIDADEHHCEVRLTSHGQFHRVGAFLSPGERVAFAAALTEALGRVRRGAPTA